MNETRLQRKRPPQRLNGAGQAVAHGNDSLMEVKQPTEVRRHTLPNFSLLFF